MNSAQPTDDGQYKVVALKYRPQSFGDLVGQGHIATALSNAIEKNRVGHAYLFTGARGVGKTSSARIFAKCLNCEKGPTTTPCNQCDTCDAISAGDDVDVLEIDGASNRGIDEIRQLRSNAAVRPGRSKYKIYIIDEVHMLTMQAFNALLKTLEEPPLHVKFIFCTTDPQKIPITVLSRCQRFDFSPVQTGEIANRLREISENEGVSADDEALALLARRANGSMRDSQSLLEQLFSFCSKQISVDEVHQLLGTADMSRIAGIATAMTNRDPTETLNLIHDGIVDGVDAGQMADQLLGYFRDMMAVRVGCGEDTMLNCTAVDMEHLSTLAETLGLETILTVVQLLDDAVVRMQSSLHARTLLEAAAIRICNLEKLESISDLVNRLSKTGGTNSPAVQAAAQARPRVQMRQVEYKKSGSDLLSKKNVVTNPAGMMIDEPETVEDAAVEIDVAPTSVAPTAFDSTSVAPTATGQATVGTSQASSVEAKLDVHEPDLASGESNPGSIESDSATDEEEPTRLTPPDSPESAPTGASPTGASPAIDDSAASDSSEVTGDNIESFWKQMLDEMGDMTADLASEFESVALQQPDQLVVTLLDSVNKDLCSKPERKQRFEAELERITGAKIRVDFMASKRAREEHAPVPKLSRAQQIRKLQDVSFVKQAISLFDGEITGYQEPARTNKNQNDKI